MKKFSLALACALCIFLLASAPGAATELRATFSGWSLQSIDPFVDGTNGRHTHSAGRGRLGAFETGGFSELLPADGTMCGSLTKFLLVYHKSNAVIRYVRDGSLLLTELVDGTVCFDTDDNTFTFDIHRSIIGGTGRFEGASGFLDSTGSGARIGGTGGTTGFTGTSSGTLILP